MCSLCTHCGWIKLLKTIITGCGSRTPEAGAHEPLWGEGESLHLAGQCFLVGGLLSPVWSHWWLLTSTGRTERQGWSWPHRSLGFWGAPAARHGFTEPSGATSRNEVWVEVAMLGAPSRGDRVEPLLRSQWLLLLPGWRWRAVMGAAQY